LFLSFAIMATFAFELKTGNARISCGQGHMGGVVRAESEANNTVASYARSV